MAKGSIVNQKVTILDEDLQELVGKSSLKRKEIMGATADYLNSEGLLVEEDKRFFKPDALIKSCLNQIGVKATGKTPRSTLLKLFGGAARDAGLVDY